MKDGFGNIMKSLGFIIVLGTTLGVLLEHTGSKSDGRIYFKKVGKKALAMSLYRVYCRPARVLRFRLYCFEWAE